MHHQKQLKNSRPALRLVNTSTLTRDEWLTVRKNGIGSSDAAAAVGLNPYQSPLELWMIKSGRDHLLPKVDPNDESTPLYWGSLLEPIVAAHYTRRTGNRVRKINAVLQHPDPDKAWMLANIDREILGTPSVQILECKTAGEFGTRLWRDGVPDYVLCQVQHQLAVTGKAAADVCVLICGQEIQVFRVDRDESLIANLIMLERAFWHYVETDTPPPADGSESAGKALQCLYPHNIDPVVDFTQDTRMSTAFSDLISLQSEIALLEQHASQLKQTIQQRMNGATRAQFDVGTVSWKRAKDSVGLDVEHLLLDHPELAKQYPLIKPGSRRFLVST
ncbi:endonuclease [Herbaspirillum lusitanum]|uniref:YqaJ viral recombinase family nuclease n=1 Tax=Herbaspirillum lusitanum TaxID=213312 RepID=UPI002237530B|nr:YqaJ viral recombinase family protein [Herbaspirillum lusitanum]MCW5297758.1 endonuclease [Herbaspirillum lusitanum]